MRGAYILCMFVRDNFSGYEYASSTKLMLPSTACEPYGSTEEHSRVLHREAPKKVQAS